MNDIPGTRGRPWTAIAWIAWAVAAVALSGQQFSWQVAYFKSPGEQFYGIFVGLLAVSPLAFAVYLRLRRRSWWRYELAAVGAVPLAAALLYQTRAGLVAVWVLVSCYALGRFALRKVGLAVDSAPEEIAISSGLGLGVLLQALFVLGMLHLFRGWAFTLLLGAPLVLLWRDAAALWRGIRKCQSNWVNTPGASTALGGLLAPFAIVFAVCGAMVALSPSLTFDVLALHLPAAEHYAAVHGVQPLPTSGYTYFPQSIECLMSLGLVLGGQPAAQMLPPLFFAPSLLLGFSIARRCGADRLAAAGGVVLAGAVPALHWTGSVAKNDFAVAFFALAALDCYFLTCASGELRWLHLGAFFLAAACGVKDTAFLALPAAAVLYTHAAWLQPRRIHAIASPGVIFLACGLVWQVRAFLLTGNPVFPITAGRATLGAQGSLTTVALRYLATPWNLQFHGIPFFESPLEMSLGVTLLMFAPVWVLDRRRPVSANERSCLVFAAVYLLCSFWFPARSMRYMAAALLLLVLLTGCRAIGLWFKGGPATQWPLLAGVAYCLLFALCGTMIIEINAPQLRLFAGRVDGREYLREAYPPYPPLEFLHERWHPGDWILSAGNCATAYSPDPARFNCLFSQDERFDPALIRAELVNRPYRFLVLPTGTLEGEIAGAGAIPIYRDTHFAVYEAAVREQSGFR